MNRLHLLLIGWLLGLAISTSAQQTKPQPPVADRIPYTIKGSFGDREDPYYWLNNRDNKAVIDLLKAENIYTAEVMGPDAGIQKQLFSEMVGRIQEDEQGVPYRKGEFYYYYRYEADGEYPIYCRRKGSMEAPEEIIINGNELAKGKKFLSFDIELSHDQTKVCVIADIAGRNFYQIRIKDLQTGKWLKDKIYDTRNGCVWAKDDKSIIYSVPDKVTLRVYQVKKHVIGTKAQNDILLLQEDDETLDISVYESRSEEYIFVDAIRTDATVIKFTSSSNPGEFKVIEPLSEGVIYSADHVSGNDFMVLTNYEAKNYRLCRANINQPNKEKWTNIIPARENVFLEDIIFFENFFVAQESSNGLTRLRIISPGLKDSFIEFDEPAYYATLGVNAEMSTNTFQYVYSSVITPFTTYEYNFKTGEKTILKQEIIPSGYNKADYTTERIMVPSRDGILIPLTIAYKNNVYKDNGTAPGFIYGYGSYGYSNEDYFDSNILSLLDRGFVYANTHIRGGQEMGGSWYDNGKMMNKKNTFYDFIDCSKYLIDHGYVAPDKLFANGGSAGGLLMGAVANFAPELYRGIIADVPFVDVITTMEDETIPLTTFEWLEWGNPKIKEQYEYMMSYSPYDNVTAKNYPNMLVTTGLNDSQVQYFEPAKWVAKLRYTKTDNNLLLFKINMDAGHGGQSGRYEYVNEIAFMYTFMLHCLEQK